MTIPDTKQITLTIDAKPVTVPAGTTVLEAARQLGIHIPTLCPRGWPGTGLLLFRLRRSNRGPA